MKKTLVIIDGNSLINRAYFAVQRPMITKEGIYTQGIFGFLNMLSKIKDEYEPGYIVVTFDLKAPTFRHLEYSDYKAGRKGMPPELAMELPYLKDILHAMRIRTMELEGFEADDLIGTISRLGEEAELNPLIITGDRDALQLASEIPRVLITKKGISEFELYDYDAMIERYELTPTQFIDLKGIMGDKSDNIPGIKGIGEKGGIELLKQFGSIENMLLHTDEIAKKGLRAKVEDEAQMALLSKKLATINRFVPLELDFEELIVNEPDYPALIELYRKLEFNSFLKKMTKVNSILQAKGQASDISALNDNEKPVYSSRSDLSDQSAISLSELSSNLDDIVVSEDIRVKFISDTDKLSEMDSLRGREVYLKVFGDDSHVQYPTVDGIFIMSTNEAFYLKICDMTDMQDIENDGESIKRGEIRKVLAHLKELELRLYGHHLKDDLFMLMMYGLSSFDVAFDTAIAEYVLDPAKSKYDLNAMSLSMLKSSLPDEGASQTDMFTDIAKQNSELALSLGRTVFAISNIQKKAIEDEGLGKILYEVELPLIEVLASMEACGLYTDMDYLDSFGKELKVSIASMEEEIWKLAGESFNIRSPKQLGEILFEKLRLPSGKKNKSGYSTGADILEKIKDMHPIVPLILEYRNLTKLDSTYVEGMKPLIGCDGRIRAHFQQTVTQTGRISCTEPNLQNIPIRRELGRKLRQAFKAKEKNVLVGADYSQIELRVMAALSEDEALMDAFNKGEDIHKTTAARVLGIPYEEVTSSDRARAKAVNFGVIYGMSAFGLSDELKITRKEAERYLGVYSTKHENVKKYLDSRIKFTRETGYSETILGRKRRIPEIAVSSYMVRQLGERLAMNSPIQGTAADIIKLAMIKVYHELKKAYPDAMLVLQVHDELIIEAPKEQAEGVKRLLVENMEAAMELSVKLVAEPNVGATWFDLK